jgi:hypothetical protein
MGLMDKARETPALGTGEPVTKAAKRAPRPAGP